MNKSKFKNILLSNIDAKEYNPIYRRLVILNILLILIAFLFLSFSIYYILVKDIYVLGFIYLAAFLSIIYTMVNLRKTQNIKLASVATTYNVFIALFVLVIYREANDFTLAWTIFMPIAAIFINGSKKGLYISLFFYVILFVLAYKGIGVWQYGLWNLSSFIRLVLISSFLTLIIYMFEFSLERAFVILTSIREKEQDYIQELENLSITDSLTSLYNRRYLDDLFHKNFNKAKKGNEFFAFFILDIDFFKKYNDTNGHIKGDKVLVDVANILKQNMRRESDTAFRLGGEEFACLVMEKDALKVFEHVEKIRQEIEDKGLVTVSFGVCIINNFEYESFDEMYKIADKFLYEAKNSGKNKIIGELVKLKKD